MFDPDELEGQMQDFRGGIVKSIVTTRTSKVVKIHEKAHGKRFIVLFLYILCMMMNSASQFNFD